MELGPIPWLLTILTAGWFGWMANRAGRTWILWAVGGVAFGLVTSTIVLGLGQAANIPFSDHERRVDQAEWATVAVLLILIIGLALTSNLHHHHLAIWRKIRPGQGSTEPTSAEVKPGSPLPLAKQPNNRA